MITLSMRKEIMILRGGEGSKIRDMKYSQPGHCAIMMTGTVDSESSIFDDVTDEDNNTWV